VPLSSLYAVPIWNSTYPFFDESKELIADSFSEFQKNNPESLTPYGYRSPKTLQLFVKLRPLFEHFCSVGFDACKDLNFTPCNLGISEAQLHINDLNFTSLEKSQDSVFSGIFDFSFPEKGGNIRILNPSINRSWRGSQLVTKKDHYTSELMKIEPKSGNLLLFPSYLQHYVEPSNLNGDSDRVFITFNMMAMPSEIDIPQQEETQNIQHWNQ